MCIVHGTANKIVDVSYAKRAAEVYRSTTPETLSKDMSVSLYIIGDGAHMLSKKHDVNAMKKLEDIADLA